MTSAQNNTNIRLEFVLFKIMLLPNIVVGLSVVALLCCCCWQALRAAVISAADAASAAAEIQLLLLLAGYLLAADSVTTYRCSVSVCVCVCIIISWCIMIRSLLNAYSLSCNINVESSSII